MSQQLNDLTIETWVAANTTVHRMQQDLLSLRAAVRRVISVDDEYKRGIWNSVKMEAAFVALRAEMATIDTQPDAGGETQP